MSDDPSHRCFKASARRRPAQGRLAFRNLGRAELGTLFVHGMGEKERGDTVTEVQLMEVELQPTSPATDDAEASTPRRRRWIPLAIFVLSLVLTIVGFVDVASAAAGARLFGGIIALVGITIAAGAVASWRGLEWTPTLLWPAVVALGALVAHHVVLFITELVSFELFDSRLLWFSVALAVLFTLVLVDALRARQPRRERRPTPQRSRRDITRDSIGLTAVIGIAFTGLSFWYTEVYLPTIRPPFLNVTVGATPIALGTPVVDGSVPLELAFDVTNPGQIRVRILAGWFNVTGAERPAADESAFHSWSLDARYAAAPADDGREILVHGVFPEEGWWLEPGEAVHRQVVVYVPAQGFEAVEVDLELAISRGEKVSATPIVNPELTGLLTDVEGTEDAPGSHAIGHSAWTIRPQSLLDWLRRDPLSIVIQWRRTDDGLLYALSDVQHKDQLWIPSSLPPNMSAWTDEQFTLFNERWEIMESHLAELGVLVHTYALAEIPLWESAQKP